MLLLLVLAIFSCDSLRGQSSGEPSYSCSVSNWTLTVAMEEEPTFGTCHYFSSRSIASSPEEGRSCRYVNGSWALLPAHKGDHYLIASAFMVKKRVTGGSLLLTHTSANYVPESSLVATLRSASLAGPAAPVLTLASLFDPGEECLVFESLVVGVPEYHESFQVKFQRDWKFHRNVVTNYLGEQYRREREQHKPPVAAARKPKKLFGCLDHRDVVFMKGSDDDSPNDISTSSNNSSDLGFQNVSDNSSSRLESLVSTHFPSARPCNLHCYGELYRAGTIMFRISRQLPTFLLFVFNPYIIMMDWNGQYSSVGVQALLSILGHKKHTGKLIDWSEHQITSVIEAVKRHHADCSHPYNQSFVRSAPADQRTAKGTRAQILALVRNTSSVDIDQLVSPPLCPESVPAAACKISNACVDSSSELLYNGICLESSWPPKEPLSKLVVSPTETTVRRPPPYIQHPPNLVSVHVNRQVFVDDFLIDWNASSQVERTWFQAQLVAELSQPPCGLTLFNSAIEGPNYDVVYLYTTVRRKLVRFTLSLTEAKVLKVLQQVKLTGVPGAVTTSSLIDRGQWAGNCRYVFGLVTLADKIPSGVNHLRVYCSFDGLDFSLQSTPGLAEDGFAMFYNRFRNVTAIVLRANPYWIRMQRYAEFPKNGTLPDNVWIAVDSRPKHSSRVPPKCALEPNSTSCSNHLLNLAWSDIRATPDDLHFRRHWEEDVNGYLDNAKRVTDVYVAMTSQYHSLMMTIAAFHYAGKKSAKLTYPALLFSRDSFRHTGASWLTRQGMLADYKPGYGACLALPSRAGNSRNQSSTLYIFCNQAHRYDGLKTCASLYSIRSDGFAAIVPRGVGRGDFWTRWLSVPFSIASLFVSARLTGASELTPCFYPLRDQGDGAFCFRTASSSSNTANLKSKTTADTLDYLEFKVPETHNLSVGPHFFRLRFRMKGVVRLYSFWFDKTVWIRN